MNALAAESSLIMEMLSAANFEIGVISEDEFVIESRPIALASEGLLQAEVGKTAMWFPLAPDVAVRPKFKGPSCISEFNTKQVREINVHILRQSD